MATAVTVLLVVVGGWWLLRAPDPPTEAGLPFATRAGVDHDRRDVAADRRRPTPTVLVVHVAGAVVRAGRLRAARRGAGARRHRRGRRGTAEASTGSLNLAAPLGDGERVYVPRRRRGRPGTATGRPVTPRRRPTGPVDLNRATAAELDALPGIGPATAQAIVDHREANGPFASVDDLEAVRGIGPAKLEAIRPLVVDVSRALRDEGVAER